MAGGGLCPQGVGRSLAAQARRHRRESATKGSAALPHSFTKCSVSPSLRVEARSVPSVPRPSLPRNAHNPPHALPAHPHSPGPRVPGDQHPGHGRVLYRLALVQEVGYRAGLPAHVVGARDDWARHRRARAALPLAEPSAGAAISSPPRVHDLDARRPARHQRRLRTNPISHVRWRPDRIGPDAGSFPRPTGKPGSTTCTPCHSAGQIRSSGATSASTCSSCRSSNWSRVWR